MPGHIGQSEKGNFNVIFMQESIVLIVDALKIARDL